MPSHFLNPHHGHIHQIRPGLTRPDEKETLKMGRYHRRMGTGNRFCYAYSDSSLFSP